MKSIIVAFRIYTAMAATELAIALAATFASHILELKLWA